MMASNFFIILTPWHRTIASQILRVTENMLGGGMVRENKDRVLSYEHTCI